MRGEMSGEAHNSGRKPPPAPSQRSRCCSSPENPACTPWSGPPTQLKLPTHVHMHTYNAATTPYPASHPRPRRQRAAALPPLQLSKVPDLQDEARDIAPAPVQTADHSCRRPTSDSTLPPPTDSGLNPPARRIPTLDPTKPGFRVEPQEPGCAAAAVMRVHEALKGGKLPVNQEPDASERPRAPRQPLGSPRKPRQTRKVVKPKNPLLKDGYSDEI